MIFSSLLLFQVAPRSNKRLKLQDGQELSDKRMSFSLTHRPWSLRRGIYNFILMVKEQIYPFLLISVHLDVLELHLHISQGSRQSVWGTLRIVRWIPTRRHSSWLCLCVRFVLGDVWASCRTQNVTKNAEPRVTSFLMRSWWRSVDNRRPEYTLPPPRFR